jgi:hypothetical protein
MLSSTDRVETYPKGPDPGLLQRGGPAGDQLQDLQVLVSSTRPCQHIKLEMRDGTVTFR